MIGVSAKVNLRGVEGGLFRRLNLFAKDLRPAWRELRKPALADQRDHMKRKASPKGRWAPLAASTRERYKQKRAAGKKTPRGLLGKLGSGPQVKIDRMRMSITARAPWSNIHKKGGRAGRSLIPARDFFWISRQLRRQVLRVMLRAAKARR